MDENIEKNLDSLSRKVVKDASLERPSENFMDSVMAQVTALEDNRVTVYQPLISRKGWILIAIIFLSVMSYAIFNNQNTEPGWFGTLDFSIFYKNEITTLLTGVSIPQVLTYAVVLFGGMFGLQISLLKHHFNQRLQH